jgi:threonyl-tRNA synthetase
MQVVYGLFGFEFQLELSTRPEHHLGTVETWDAAEAVDFLNSGLEFNHVYSRPIAATEAGS